MLKHGVRFDAGSYYVFVEIRGRSKMKFSNAGRPPPRGETRANNALGRPETASTADAYFHSRNRFGRTRTVNEITRRVTKPSTISRLITILETRRPFYKRNPGPVDNRVAFSKTHFRPDR